MIIKNKISIIIPTKNRSYEVNRLLNQIIEQSYKPNEIIIVDDSQNLETKKIIKKHKLYFSDNNIKLRHAWDSGSSSRARLIGGLIAEGDIIVYIDDDLDIEINCIEILVKTLEKKSVMVVWGKINFMDLKTNRLMKVFSMLYYHFLFGASKKYGGGLFAIRKKVLEDKVWFDWNLTGYSLYEDMDFALNLCKKYGLKNVIRLEKYLAVDRGKLVKSKRYYKVALCNTLYYSKKWGGIKRLLIASIILPFLSAFYIITTGVRGISSISRIDILKSYLETVKNLRLILAGKLDKAYY